MRLQPPCWSETGGFERKLTVGKMKSLQHGDRAGVCVCVCVALTPDMGMTG